MRTASTSAERFEIRLHSLLHREISQQLAIIPGKEILTVGREIRIEVIELAVIDLAWSQLVSLRDELTRAIAAAVPITPDKAAERLAQLTAQIAVTEGALSHSARDARAEAATPSSQEFARLNDQVGMLADRLDGVAAQPPIQSGDAPTSATRLRPIVTTCLGVALLATIVGLSLWPPPSAGLRAWFPQQPTGVERPGAVPSSGGGGMPSGLQAKPVPRPPPSLALSGGAGIGPEAAPAPEPPARSPVEPRAEAAVSPGSGDQHPEQPVASALSGELGAAAPSTPAPLATGPEAKAGAEAELAPPPVDVPMTASTPPAVPPAPPPSPSAAEATSPEATAVAGVASAANDASVPPGETGPHLAIHVEAETWIRVRDGAGRNYIARVLKAGETWPVPAIPGLVLTSGNSGSTFLITDGVTGPALGPEKAVRTARLP